MTTTKTSEQLEREQLDILNQLADVQARLDGVSAAHATQLRAALLFLGPAEMTPPAIRMLQSIADEWADNAASPPSDAAPDVAVHTEHVTVTDVREWDCLEGGCDHLDERGEPEDMSACPIFTVEVCVRCMVDRYGLGPGEWEDLSLVEWPCPSAPIDDAEREEPRRG